jgi:phosphatidylserine/phosphatidylglycerophosphate/cardiolipin synthase-like enzyme
MAEFLNTKKIRDYIEKIIETAERELVIISPYLQIDEYLINLLKNADARGVETTLVYKEQKVNDAERNKLKQIDNLNLLHHPNIHCKTYYNEKYLIITSMNLFD